MSAFKGTPGPWHVEESAVTPRHYRVLESRFGRGKGDIAYLASLISTKQTKANAHLIAAAPELLESLMQMVERISYYAELKEEGIPNIEDWAYTYNSGDMQRARAAIAKATGGAA